MQNRAYLFFANILYMACFNHLAWHLRVGQFARLSSNPDLTSNLLSTQQPLPNIVNSLCWVVAAKWLAFDSDTGEFRFESQAN